MGRQHENVQSGLVGRAPALFREFQRAAARAQGGILSGSQTAAGEELPSGVRRIGNVEF